jgi:hypothetical protein
MIKGKRLLDKANNSRMQSARAIIGVPARGPNLHAVYATLIAQSFGERIATLLLKPNVQQNEIRLDALANLYRRFNVVSKVWFMPPPG